MSVNSDLEGINGLQAEALLFMYDYGQVPISTGDAGVHPSTAKSLVDRGLAFKCMVAGHKVLKPACELSEEDVVFLENI